MNNEITVTAANFTATVNVADLTVEIVDAEGVWVGDGVWEGRIAQCAAPIGDAAYEALDCALIAALDESLADD